MDITSKFAQRLNFAMAKLNLKQVDICNATGIKHTTMSNYVLGMRIPKDDNFVLIADYLNVDYAWLMGYDVPMERETDNHKRLRERVRDLVLYASDSQLEKVIAYCEDIGLKKE